MDLDQLWKNTQEELKVILAPAVYQTFVHKTQLTVLKDNVATIACPNPYLADINKKRYYELFKGALDNQTKTNNTLNFIIQEPIKNESESVPPGPLFTSFTRQSFSGGGPTPSSTNLHPKYTFDNLIVGNSNNFAFAAAQGIVKNPGASYNPFFIWGGVGVGKTHLMQAIGHELLKNDPNLKIKYFPAETFGNELIASLKSKSISQFKEKYRKLDCILVDDIQFIAGKEYTQEEFFHTFNALHITGKQVILTSDRKPNDIKDLEDRLVSRFLGGLTVDIQPPDFEMRVAIINQKVEARGVKINPEASLLLADSIQSNIREIEGKIQQLVVQANAAGVGEITLDFLQNSNSAINESRITNNERQNPRHIISVCAKHFNIKTGDLCGSCRSKDLVLARHITAYLLLTEIKLPLKEVGHLLGGRDHTSIMHARDKIATDFSTNPQIRQFINTLKSSF